MLVGAVTGVHDRNGSHARGDGRRPGHGMPHHDHVRVVGDDPDGILEGFPLALGGILGVREAYNPGPETVDGGFEREPGPCGRLEEKACYHLSCKEILLPASLEFFCYLEDM